MYLLCVQPKGERTPVVGVNIYKEEDVSIHEYKYVSALLRSCKAYTYDMQEIAKRASNNEHFNDILFSIAMELRWEYKSDHLAVSTNYEDSNPRLRQALLMDLSLYYQSTEISFLRSQLVDIHGSLEPSALSRAIYGSNATKELPLPPEIASMIDRQRENCL